MDEDEWWATLSPSRKAQIRRWLDQESEEAQRRAAAAHPDQLALLEPGQPALFEEG